MMRFKDFLTNWRAGAVLAVLLLTAAGATQAQQPAGAPDDAVKVTATGQSSWRPDDAARSRDEALEAARRDAVEQVSGTIISSESEMKNFDLVRDEVLTKTQGFVRNSKIIKEGPPANNLYPVTIEAEVVKSAFMKEVNSSLEQLYSRVGRPRVMVAIKESSKDSSSSESTSTDLAVSEKEIRKVLLAQGFTFIDPKTTSRSALLQLKEKGKDADPNLLQQLAQSTKAEIIITGTARTSVLGGIGKFNRVQADLSLDAVRTDNGQIIASQVASAVDLHINPDTAAVNALTKAADDMTPKLMQQVSYQWIKEKNEGSNIQLVVRNTSFADLISLRRQLSNQVKGVKKVTQRSFSEGTAMLELITKDSAERLAENLSDTKFDKFSLDIVDVTPTSLVVAMKK